MQKNNSEKSNKRRLRGLVVSSKMNKTRIVEIKSLKKHKRYLKYFRATKRFKVHDEENLYKEGDKVLIEETRPLSKEKRWKIIGKI